MTSQHAYLRRVLFWASDRFPFFNAIVAFTMAFSIKGLFVGSAHFNWQLEDFLLGLVFLTHLFVLRIMDEFKDFESDKIFHPDRAVQKGIVSLGELKALGILAALIQIIAVSLLARNFLPLSLVWVVVWVWSFLMMKEFFIKEYLRKKLLLYSALHLLVSPMMFLTGWTFYASLSSNFDFYKLSLLLTLSFSTGLMFEFARKNRSIAEDEKGEISFSLIWGRKVTSAVVLAVTILALVIGYLYLREAQADVLVYLAVAILTFALAAMASKKFVAEPTDKNHKKARSAVELNVIWSFLGSFLIVLLR